MVPFQQKYRTATIGVLISLTFMSVFLYLIQSEPAEVRAELSQLGDISFTYSGKQNSGISPLCGCYAEKPREQWRGITFPGRYINIERKGTKPLTGFMITAAAFMVPIQLNTAEQKAAIHLKATSETFLNSVPLNRRTDKYGMTYLLYRFLSVLISVLSLLVSIRSLVKKNAVRTT